MGIQYTIARVCTGEPGQMCTPIGGSKLGRDEKKPGHETGLSVTASSHQRIGLPSASTTVTSPQPSERTPASILRRSPITIHTASSGLMNLDDALASCSGLSARTFDAYLVQ